MRQQPNTQQEFKERLIILLTQMRQSSDQELMDQWATDLSNIRDLLTQCDLAHGEKATDTLLQEAARNTGYLDIIELVSAGIWNKKEGKRGPLA